LAGLLLTKAGVLYDAQRNGGSAFSLTPPSSSGGAWT